MSDITGRLSEIDKPVLISLGDRDIAVLPYIPKEMHRRIANAQMIIPNCWHICNIEQADSFNSIVSEFLQKVETNTPIAKLLERGA